MSFREAKSALRVFEVLEYFAREQRDLSVTEVAEQCGYPQSSTSILMRTMVKAGYLDYDRGRRTYMPTARLPLLVDWIGDRIFSRGRLLHLMSELGASTGQTIILGGQIGVEAVYLRVIDATATIRLHANLGDRRPLARSAIGLAILATYDDAELGKIVRRIAADNVDEGETSDYRQVMQRVEEVRRRGYAFSDGLVTPGAGTLARVLPEKVNGRPLALGIGSVQHELHRNEREWAALLEEAIANAFSD